jgi:hypothetical protein
MWFGSIFIIDGERAFSIEGEEGEEVKEIEEGKERKEREG